MNGGHQCRPGRVGNRAIRFHDRRAFFPNSPPARGSLGLLRNANGDSVQPRWQRLSRANPTCSLDQGEKHCLKSVLGIRVVWEQLTTDRPHEGPVPAQKFLKRRFVPGLDEPGQEIRIRRATVRDADNRLKQRWCHHK